MRMRGFEKWLVSGRPWAWMTSTLLPDRLWATGQLPARAEVLQLGCGAGGETIGLAGRFPQWQLTATDIDPDMLARAGKRLSAFADRVGLQTADATALPYADGTFDAVVAVHVWHHVGQWRRATTEAYRVLRPGGVFALADFVVPHWMPRRLARVLPVGTYTLPDLQSAVAAAGFVGELRTSLGGLWYQVLARG